MSNPPTSCLTWIASLFKRKDTMAHDSWTILLGRMFTATMDITLNLYVSAAEKFADPQAFLDSFVVVWIWEFKKEDSPFHEFYIIEAEDRMQGNKLTRFVLERITKKSTTEDIKEAGGKREPSPSPSTSYPPVIVPSSQLSPGDRTSVALVKGASSVSDSLDKYSSKATDQFLGEGFVDSPRFAEGAQCIGQFKPKNLKLFEFILLADVVHDWSPTYSRLGDNCYWLVFTISGVIRAQWGVDTPNAQDAARQNRYTVVPDLAGRWHGVRISAPNKEEITAIVAKYRVQYEKDILHIKKLSRLLTAAQDYAESTT